MRRRHPASASRRRARRSGTRSRPPQLPPYGNYPNPLPWAPCGYKPDQLRNAYGVTGVLASGIDGSGVTVAIVDAYASPTIVSDATTYAQRNDPTHPFKKSKFSQKAYRPFYDGGPNKCDASGWYGEETLDVEAVHTMAPGASIYFVGVKSCNNVDSSRPLNDLVDGHKADIVSNSYGDLGESTAADRNATTASSRRPRSRASASTSPPATVGTRATPATAAPSRPPTSRPPRRS